MSSQNAVQPPRIAVWLVSLFTPPTETESITGDLVEEFLHVSSNAGVTLARRWYWRQTVKTIAHLLLASFCTAPWTITAAAVSGFLLRWLVSRSFNEEQAVATVLERYRVYGDDPRAYILWLTGSLLFVRLIVNTVVGLSVAIVARGREMTATIALALLGDVLAIQATLLTVAKTGEKGVLWTLAHTFAFSIAIVVAGAIVRTRRSTGTCGVGS